MKKLIKLSLIFILGLSILVGCSASNENGSTSNSLDAIKEAGVLRIGTNSGYPPYQFFDTRNNQMELVGFDIDLGQKIADALGVELEFVDIDFDALIPSLLTNQFDMILAGMVPTAQRAEMISFSDLYFASHKVIVGNTETVGDLGDISNLYGKRVAVQSGTTQAGVANMIEGAIVVEVPAISDTVAQVLSGQADVLIISQVSAANIVSSNPSLAYVPIVGIDEADLFDGAAAGIPQGHYELIALVNSVIYDLNSTGLLDEMFVAAQQLADEVLYYNNQNN